MKRWALRTAVVAALSVILWFAPLVRVVPLSAATHEGESPVEFDPAEYAERFWQESLIPAIGNATPANDAIAAMADDAEKAKEEFGRTVGVGRSYFVFLRGEGQVVEVTRRTVALRVGESATAIVQLSRGAIFGAAIRDATGLLKADDFMNSQDYNAVANHLNRLAEERVVPRLAECEVGDQIGFAGCAKVSNPSRYKPPLELSPILVESL